MNWTDEEIKAGIEHCFEDAEDIFLVSASLNVSRKGYQLIAKCESDSGITIDQLARINRSIHNNLSLPGLDIENVTVEVSSPGADYPVTMPRHFQRLSGQIMRIEHNGTHLPSPLEGEIIDASEQKLTLRVEQDEVILSMAEVVQGKVKLKW